VVKVPSQRILSTKGLVVLAERATVLVLVGVVDRVLVSCEVVGT